MTQTNRMNFEVDILIDDIMKLPQIQEQIGEQITDVVPEHLDVDYDVPGSEWIRVSDNGSRITFAFDMEVKAWQED